MGNNTDRGYDVIGLKMIWSHKKDKPYQADLRPMLYVELVAGPTLPSAEPGIMIQNSYPTTVHTIPYVIWHIITWMHSRIYHLHTINNQNEKSKSQF